MCVYHIELGSGNKTNTNQESLLCHRSHLVWESEVFDDGWLVSLVS